MRRVTKIKIPAAGRRKFEVLTHEGATVVHVGTDFDDDDCIWIEENTNAQIAVKTVSVVATGDRLPLFRQHVGSFKSEPFIWHVYA